MSGQDAGHVLTCTDQSLLGALAVTLGPLFGQERLMVDAYHTGGGCMVAAVDLTIDARLLGRQLWLTREGPNEWLLGMYDWHTDPEDEGVCVFMHGSWDYSHGRAFDAEDWSGFSANDPRWVASEVAGVLRRLGVHTLQGEEA